MSWTSFRKRRLPLNLPLTLILPSGLASSKTAFEADVPDLHHDGTKPAPFPSYEYSMASRSGPQGALATEDRKRRASSRYPSVAS
jgi:hypothetical protein